MKYLIMTIVSTLLITGCSLGANISQEMPTLGMELIDAQHALDQGAISAEEHEEIKGALLRK